MPDQGDGLGGVLLTDHDVRLDADFRTGLENWQQQAKLVRTGAGEVRNQISGGTQRGPLGILFKQRGQPAEAEQWYRQAATNGHAKSMSNLAFMLYWGGQLDEAEQWWRQAAQMGISSAQTNLTILLQQRGRLQG
ncbi:hypothetical protein GCM10009601_48850 [Streptomyces thermospinosisporus]|uniref:Sel1 repeat family protein n=1 Tax=Streptomyces thermospinosisporus TaxID=161482 RepID=A0ABN1Z407_9ACTN